jgi:hypothetical protein
MVVKGGCEAMVYGIQVVLDVHFNCVVLQMDVMNAFNIISHNKAIFKEL